MKQSILGNIQYSDNIVIINIILQMYPSLGKYSFLYLPKHCYWDTYEQIKWLKVCTVTMSLLRLNEHIKIYNSENALYTDREVLYPIKEEQYVSSMWLEALRILVTVYKFDIVVSFETVF